MLNVGSRNRSVIAGNLDAQLTDQGMNLEKAIEIIKTGKEVRDAILSRVSKIDDAIALCRADMNDAKQTVGFEPDLEEDYSFSIGDDGEEEKCKRYKMDYDGSRVAEQDKVAKNKRKYNDCCWKLRNLQSRRKQLKLVADNLKDTQRFKLSTYELTEYGFAKATKGFEKAHVKAHTRKTKSGKLENVKEHTRKIAYHKAQAKKHREHVFALRSKPETQSRIDKVSFHDDRENFHNEQIEKLKQAKTGNHPNLLLKKYYKLYKHHAKQSGNSTPDTFKDWRDNLYSKPFGGSWKKIHAHLRKHYSLKEK